MADPGSKFINPNSIKIDPSLGVVNSGTTDIPAPAFNPETGAAAMPAAVQTGAPQTSRTRTFHKFGPGSTLAERLGTDEAAQTSSVQLPVYETHRPTEMPPQRIVPKVSKAISAKEMSERLQPNWEKLGEQPVASGILDTEYKPEPEYDPPKESPESIAPVVKADLAQLVRVFIQKFGVEKSAEFFGRTPAVISGWIKDKEPPLAAAQMVLDKSPKAKQQYLKVVEKVFIDWQTGEGSFSREHTKEQIPADLCFCVKGDIPPYVFWALQTAVAQYGIGCKMLTDTIIIRSRNMVADMFLKGTAQWSIWIDADILPTIGNSAWWHAIVRDGGSVHETTASYDFIKRLLGHNKPFTGGVFATRRKNGPLVIQPDLHPRGQADKTASNAIRKNEAKGLLEVEWLSAGLCCVHRSVFESVKKKRPDLQPKIHGEPYPFFTPTGNIGEDVAFSQLAREAGFKLYLDCELFAAHVGRYAFIPSESQFNGILDFTNA